MAMLGDAVATTVAVITAMGALGTAASGLVDVTKAFWGGVSNAGFGHVLSALKPFEPALDNATSDWRASLRANWINGMAKEDQKTAAKTLIRLGLSSQTAAPMAAAGHVDPAELAAAMGAVEKGGDLTTGQAQLFGRMNAVIDAAMDAGFERGDQQYRNWSKVLAGVFSLILSVWAGALVRAAPLPDFLTSPQDVAYFGSSLFWWSVLVGLLSVPIAPIAKDLASSLQTAATAVTSLKR